MKKIITMLLAILGAQMLDAQVQYKIADPSTDAGLTELRNADFYKKQLTALGFTDKDVTIKTYPLWKFYSEEAGVVTKSLVEADGAAFHVEATTKKNPQGVIYKMEGNIIFRRCDVEADDFGAYNAKLRNNWKVYHLNVTDFIPTNRNYIVAPEVVKTMLITGLSDGSIPADFIPISSGGSSGYYDLIQLKDISYITDDKATYSEFKTEVLSATEQRMCFSWDLEIALFTKDSGYIAQIEQITGLICKVYVNTSDGQPKITSARFNYGDKKTIFQKAVDGNEAYDTLFCGMKSSGFLAVNGQRKIVTSSVLHGARKEQFLKEFAEAICKLSGSETEPELQKIVSAYASISETATIVKWLQSGFQAGFSITKTDEYDGHRLEWTPKTKASKKAIKPAGYKIVKNSISCMRYENGAYKYQNR